MINKILEDVKEALYKYNSDNIDVVRNEETNCLYVTYHSRHNSFPISDKEYPIDEVNLKELEIKLDELGVGYVW